MEDFFSLAFSSNMLIGIDTSATGAAIIDTVKTSSLVGLDFPLVQSADSAAAAMKSTVAPANTIRVYV